jgi:hypothetical protein
MSRLDHETTDLASAGQYDRDHTPGPGLRDDWPDPGDCVTETGIPATGPLIDALESVLASFGRGRP